MSDGGAMIRIRLETGETYDMPESEAFPAMKELDAKGTKFSADDAPQQKAPEAEMTVGAPTIIKNAGTKNERELPAVDPGEDPIRDELNSPEFAQNTEHLKRMSSDPLYALTQLGKLGVNYLGGAFGAAGVGEGVLANAGRQAVAGAVPTAINSYADHPDAGVLDALVKGGESGLYAGGTAAALGGLGELAAAGGDRARMAATNTDMQDLRKLGITPREFNQMTERAGLNNDILPVSHEGKTLRALDRLEESGTRVGDAIAEADAQGLGKGPFGKQVADDLYAARDPVWHSGSGNRENIVGQLGKMGSAADDATIESLADLRRYKTNRANEGYDNALGDPVTTAYGKANRIAADSAKQVLDGQMAQSDAENYRKFVDANRDYGEASVLEELLSQRQTPPGILGDVGAGIAGAAISGGNPVAMAASMGARRMAGPMAADAMANLGGGLQRNLGAASQMTGTATSATEQLQSARNNARGQEIPTIVENLLQQPQQPPWFQPYAQVLSKAKEDGNLIEKLYQLENGDDQNWKRTALPQLQQLSASQ